MGCDLWAALRLGSCLNCDFEDLGMGCDFVVGALRGSCLNCDFEDLGMGCDLWWLLCGGVV